MRNIRFTIEDSKVAEILKVILNSSITVHGIEVTNTQRIQSIKTLDGKEDNLCKKLNKHIYKMDTLIESIFSFVMDQKASYCILEV